MENINKIKQEKKNKSTQIKSEVKDYDKVVKQNNQ